MRFHHFATPLALALALGACGLNGTDRLEEEEKSGQAASGTADQMASNDPTGSAPLDPNLADDTPRPIMQAQVVLDRLGFTPGVVDGEMGMSTRNALRGFQEASKLNPTGELDDATKAALEQWENIPATRIVTIPADFAAGPFAPIPDEPEDQAKLKELGYETLDEKLAERFHTTVAVLKMLNPGGVPSGAPNANPTPVETPEQSPSPSASGSDTPLSTFRAGQQIRVPNIGGDRIDAASVKDKGWLATLTALGVGTEQPKADKIVVSKSKGTLSVFDAAGKLVALFTVTSGSSRDPLPIGDWKILGVGYNPPFHYNPELFWDVADSEDKQLLPPGPNGPVGVAWIDLSKEHYGIHGTPNPETIGRAESHGCVRLTNWDVARLAQMVSTKTKVSFIT